MKNNFTSLITGIIIGAVLFGSLCVYADGEAMIKIYYNVKDIVINKVSKMPEEEKPFIYNGRTYVPLRYIAENLGYEVDWDYETSSVLIGETEKENSVYPGEKPNGIDYMNYQEGHTFNSFRYGYNTSIIKDNVGNEFDSYILMYIDDITTNDSAWNYLEFPLNEEYEYFKGVLGLTNEYKNTEDVVMVEIHIDEKLEKKYTFMSGSMPKEISIDVEGAKKIMFKMYTNGGSNAQIGLFDAYFTK